MSVKPIGFLKSRLNQSSIPPGSQISEPHDCSEARRKLCRWALCPSQSGNAASGRSYSSETSQDYIGQAKYKNSSPCVKQELLMGSLIADGDGRGFLSRGESNSDRFSRAAFRQCFGKSLENTGGYSLRDFPCLAKKLLRENCAAPHSKDFCFGFLRR